VISAPHPLAAALIKRLHFRPESRVLDFGAGSGRNGDALRRAGFAVVTVGDDAAASEAAALALTGRFDAALSTHGLLHGSPRSVEARLRAIASRLGNDGLLYATFGSKHDSRFGRGERIDDSTFAPDDGDERGVPHAYFDREQLRALLELDFEIESLQEQSVDDVAGAWAHRELPLAGAYHWFAVGRRR
jgi:Methyltransferase domain